MTTPCEDASYYFPYILIAECVLTRNGIEEQMLLSYTGSDSNIQHLSEVPFVTNELILELARFKHRHPKCTFRTLYFWMKDIFGDKWPLPDSPTCQAIVKSIERLDARFLKLKKQHSSVDKDIEISDFLKEEFSLPQLGYHKGKIVNFSPLARNQDLAKKHQSAKMYEDVRKKLYAANRNANKRLKRREAKIQEQEKLIREQQEAISKYEQKICGTESKLKKMRMKLDRINHRAVYWEKKAYESRSKKNGAKLRAEMASLKDEIASLDLENADLNEAFQSVMSQSEMIQTMKHGKYTDEIRTCVYELLSLNVGVRNVAPIIQCVLKNVAHKSVSKLPSYGLTCQMILESLAVAQAQLGDCLSETSGYCTLQTDGTTKFGEHYATYDVSVPNESTSYSLGMRHVFSGSASNTLEAFKQILSDVDDVYEALGKDSISSKVLLKVKNTMSDRHAAEKLFNEMLHDYRAEVLPTIVENWKDMSELERQQLTRMNNFFCGLHYIVGLAECTDEVLKLWEAASEDTNNSSVSSGTQRLIRTASKAFHHRGSQKAGSSALFRSYLQKQNIHTLPLANFVGNRFNILFYDGAGVYYLQDLMINFIETTHGQQANLLLKSVLRDLKNPTLIAGCRGLGLIDKIITGPLWRKLSESSNSVLEMSSTYCEIKAKFDLWSEDASSLIDGSTICIKDITIHQDNVWERLIQSDSSDAEAIEVLQLLFRAFSSTTERLLVNHLPGGVHHNVVDEDIIKETSSVPTTNISPERDFAVLDRYLREKPNANLIALESLILFSHNRTATWLDQRSCDETKELLQAARMLAPSLRMKFKTRRQEIARKRQEDVQKRAQAIARKELKTVKEKEKLTKGIEKVGLWTSRMEVEDGLDAFVKNTKKREVLKLQINFRKKVLGQNHPNKAVFNFSHNRKQHSVLQLTENLLMLVGAVSDDLEGGNVTVTLEEVMQKPDLLVGKKIQHRFTVGKELMWFIGTVLSMKAETREFQVIYDGEDDICYFTLLDDIERGDLELL